MSERPDSPAFLPGEQLLSLALVVRQQLPLLGSSPVPSAMGRLECTNYCLRFIPDPGSLSEGIGTEALSDSKHIPLLSIAAVFRVSSDKNKKKLLTVKKARQKPIEHLLIVTKDLKRMRFDLSMCDKREAMTTVSTIVVYSRPTAFSQLFIHDYAKSSHQRPSNDQTTVPMFYSVHDWETELQRLKATGWHVTTSNHDFTLSLSLPPFFVVPSSITDQSLQYVRTLHKEGRLPVWCWSHPSSGAALLRAAGHVSDTEGIPSDAGYLWAISMAKDKQAQVNSKAVLPLDLGKTCCSVRDIHQSFSKLRELVLPETISELSASDRRWLTLLESTKWMDLVKSCLVSAKRVTEAICGEKQPVLLYEPEGKDITCIVSSLAQIMMDSTYRTMVGFETLVQKEWVAMGHPFASRHLMVLEPQGGVGAEETDASVTPVFLLFLNCVFQLTHQFISSFEFSETYLMSLYDHVISGLSCTFLFNSSREYFDTRRPYGAEQGASVEDNYHEMLPQAWGRWMNNLPHDVCEHCYNPFSFLFSSQAEQDSTTTAATVVGASRESSSSLFPINQGRLSISMDTMSSDFFQGGSCGLYDRTLQHRGAALNREERPGKEVKHRARITSWVVNPASEEETTVLLSPQVLQCKLKFWSGFFFRHIPLSNEPFKEVLRVEDLKSQLVREARLYKDSLKEHELKKWSYRHTLSFDEMPNMLTHAMSLQSASKESESRLRSNSDPKSLPIIPTPTEVRDDSSPLARKRESPAKPPRPWKSPITKSKVQVSATKTGKALKSSLALNEDLPLTHMTLVENGDRVLHSPVMSRGKSPPDSNPKPRMSWVTESEEVDTL